MGQTVSSNPENANKLARPADCASRLVRWIGTIEVWIGLSLAFTFLMHLSGDATGSTVWFLDPLLSVLFLFLMWAKQRQRWPTQFTCSRKISAISFVIIGWAGGMIYEFTLSESGTSYGGMHAKSIPSFILAQGWYIPLVLWGLWLVRRYQFTFRDLFFVAGMTCSYEAILFGIPMVLSPSFVLSPIVLAYYFVVYSRFLSTGLLLVDERQLWSKKFRKISFRRKLMHGVLMCIGCWIIFALWGETLLYFFDDFNAFT
jgi:hypothetical protein